MNVSQASAANAVAALSQPAPVSRGDGDHDGDDGGATAVRALQPAGVGTKVDIDA